MLELKNVGASYGDNVVLRGLNIQVDPGTCAALVGESGSGKSTAARIVMGLKQADEGQVIFEDEDITTKKPDFRNSGVEMIFQDPISSLNPRRNLLDIVSEPLVIHQKGTADERLHRAQDLLARVGLDPYVFGQRRASELSGGQAQRVAIARALAAEPRLLVCDEPVSALDVSVQAQVLNLFMDLLDEGMTMFFISHDLAVVRQISETINVLNKGQIVEAGPAEEIINSPLHPYTQQLVSAAPTIS